MIQAAGEDGVDDLYDNRHDVNEVGRLGAQSLLVNDAVHFVNGLVCPAASQWRTRSEVAPFFCPIIAGARSVVTQTRREKSRKYRSTH